MASVARGDAGPLSEAIGRASGGAGVELLTAFAISTQGLSALLSRYRDVRTLPAALSDFLFAENLHSGARAGRLLETLAGTIYTLRAADVEVVALKGAVLAFVTYPDPALRPMGDLDLLLREPRDLTRATEALAAAGWRALLDTPRHRVFVRSDERVVRPAAEDPDNPIRVEIHTTFRLPVLGRAYDASAELRAQAETRDLGGVRVAIASGPAFLRHLLFHAAGDFAGIGIRGVQAYDFRLLARARGALAPEIPSNERGRNAAPLLFAADAVQRHFPGTFEKLFLESLARDTHADLRAAAARLPSLRYTRPARGWTRTLLSVVDRPVPRIRFLLRTLFPTLGEVKANAAPESSGFSLARAWLRVFGRRLAAAARGSVR